ncbi:MAG: hypothetical protein PHH47_05450 [Gallionella sp.]|nr:hypothetical protein [Gallionella sp.]MDD4945527.1 hypothetical protein [Gallionella sp.]MDD5611849.1 hypothetical protein [Gallionella sp.]
MHSPKRRTTLLLLLASSSALAGPNEVSSSPPSAPLQDWQLSGVIQGRYDSYHVSGDSRSAPYPYLGSQGYGSFSLDARRTLSAYERLNTQLAGTLNRSEYRGVQGGILERARMEWTKGDAAMPFRLELGDVYSLHSQRTLQRGMKGMQLEVQNGAADTSHSLLLTAGRAAPTWRGLNVNREDFLAASWVLQSKAWGDFILSSVNANRQRPNGAADIRQWSGGLGWAKDMQLASQRWQVEAELTRLSGDTSAYAARRDAAQYFSLDGHDAALPLQYNLRFEKNGSAYQPLGGAVTANQKAASGQLRWRFDNGMAITGRLQSYRDGWDKLAGIVNPVGVNTDIGGITLSGRLPEVLSGNVNMDMQSQNRLADDGSQHLKNHAIRADFSHTLPAGMGLRWGVFDMTVHDLRNGVITNTREPSVSLSKRFQAGTLNGSGSLGVVRRNVSGANPAQSSWAPTLQLQLASGAHSFGFSYNFLHARANSGILELFNRQTAFRYQYRSGSHEFSVDGDLLQRNPMGNLATRAWRVGLGYSFHFEQMPADVNATPPASHVAAPASADLSERDLTLISPGTLLADAETLLIHWGAGAASRNGNLLSFDYPWFPNIAAPQQLLLEHQTGAVVRVGIQVDLQDQTPAEVQRLYARIRESLLRQFGPPTLAIEEGSFTDNWGDDLAVGRFRYLMDWQTAQGRVRLGIPQRVDGQRMVEVAVTPAGAPALNERNWSLERVR